MAKMMKRIRLMPMSASRRLGSARLKKTSTRPIPHHRALEKRKACLFAESRDARVCRKLREGSAQSFEIRHLDNKSCRAGSKRPKSQSRCSEISKPFKTRIGLDSETESTRFQQAQASYGAQKQAKMEATGVRAGVRAPLRVSGRGRQKKNVAFGLCQPDAN